MSCLYIIGNGFDIVHGLDTSFVSFRDYLDSKNSSILNLFDGYEFWNDFEYNICGFFEEPYKFLKREFNDIPNFVESIFDDISEEFFEFIKKNDYHCKPKFEFNNNDLFINFNYTPTLQLTYNIESDNVYHIHNSMGSKLLNSDEKLILGHDGNDYAFNPNLFSGKYEEDYIKFIYYTTKPYEEIMKTKEFSNFMEKCKSIDKVVVFGYSYGAVDNHYLERIIELYSSNVEFVFNYYSERDYENLVSFLDNIKYKLNYIIRNLKESENDERLY